MSGAVRGKAAGQQVSLTVGDELFAVVDILDSQVQVRRALTDPNLGAEGRAELARRLLASKISAPALSIVATTAQGDFASSRQLADALEREAIRVALSSAADPELVRQQLFDFGRLVTTDPQLSQALADRSTPAQARQELVSKLLAGANVEPATLLLAQRAARARGRDFGRTITGYVRAASALRGHLAARVSVARPLTADQEAKLRAELSRIYAAPVDLDFERRPDVIGGIRVQIGTDIIDGTVAARLDAARRAISEH